VVVLDPRIYGQQYIHKYPKDDFKPFARSAARKNQDTADRCSVGKMRSGYELRSVDRGLRRMDRTLPVATDETNIFGALSSIYLTQGAQTSYKISHSPTKILPVMQLSP
jgi:hypothetical protein